MLCRRHFRFRLAIFQPSPRFRRIDKQQGPDGFVVIVEYRAASVEIHFSLKCKSFNSDWPMGNESSPELLLRSICSMTTSTS
jgi:hypothetical protein